MAKFLLKLVSFILAALVAAVSSYAQQSTRVPRIGFVMLGSEESSGKLVAEFRQGLQELGYVDGRNIEIELRWHPADRHDLMLGAVADLIRIEPDVLVGPTTPHILALKQATTTIPIVMVVPSDPVGNGLVASLARPGGNVTGLSYMQHDILGKRLELLREIFPKMSRVASLRNPGNPAAQRDFKALEASARKLGIGLYGAEVREPNQLVSAFSSITRNRAEALIVQAEQLTWVHRQQISELAIQNRLPTMHYTREFVDAGGLMSYGANHSRQYRRCAIYVDKILKGAKPADLPIEQPTEFELIINMRTAKALGIRIPEAILLRSDDVIR